MVLRGIQECSTVVAKGFEDVVMSRSVILCCL